MYIYNTNVCVLQQVAKVAQLKPSAAFPATQNGFWADHWEYHLDLVESYLVVYPDNEKEFLFGVSGQSPFYMSPATCTVSSPLLTTSSTHIKLIHV